TKPKQLERQHSTGSSKAVAQGPRGDKRQLVGHVLIVEDNPVNLAVVRKMLQRFGLTCDTASVVFGVAGRASSALAIFWAMLKVNSPTHKRALSLSLRLY
ncbi:hypothetical protein TI04_10965, partial [Achromatium sp. WMS2]